jgi:hypothetical protein
MEFVSLLFLLTMVDGGVASCFFQRDRWQWRLRVRMDDTPDTPFLPTTAVGS